MKVNGRMNNKGFVSHSGCTKNNPRNVTGVGENVCFCSLKKAGINQCEKECDPKNMVMERYYVLQTNVVSFPR